MKGVVGDAWECIRDLQSGRTGLGQKLLGNLMVIFAVLLAKMATTF